MNVVLAGLIAGLPVAAISSLLLWVRAENFVPELKDSSEDIAEWSYRRVAGLIMGSAVAASLVGGLLAGWIYGLFVVRFPDAAALYFAVLALSVAIFLSILAVVTKTPMALEKSILHFVFALGLGLLIPWLSA